MSEVTTLPWPCKGLRSRRPGKGEPSAPGKRRGEDAVRPCLAAGGRSHLQLRGAGRREPLWRLRPPGSLQRTASARSLPELQPRAGTEQTSPSPSSGWAPIPPYPAAASRQAATRRVCRAPPGPAPSVPRVRAVAARAPCLPARPGRAKMRKLSRALCRPLPGPRRSPPASP